MDDLYQKVINQLVAAGLQPGKAKKLIKKHSSGSPVNGALELQKLGANYQDAFKVFNQQLVESPSSKPKGSPVLFLVGGGILSCYGILGVLLASSKASRIDHGLTLFFGIVFVIIGLTRVR